MQIRIDKTGPVPIHHQIKEQIAGLVHAGKLKPGEQLPTIRALSIELAVNTNTIAHAYRELDAEGLIETRRGEGTFVAPEAPAPNRAERREQTLRHLVARLLAEADRLGYSPAEVRRALASLAAEQRQQRRP